MNIKFVCREDKLYLIYSPDNENGWVELEFEAHDEITIKNTFTFTRDLVTSFENTDDYFDSFNFLLAKPMNEYFHVNKNILGIDHDVYIDKNVFVQKRIYAGVNTQLLPAVKSLSNIFIAANNISIFKQISQLHKEESIFIGGKNPLAIPLSIFNILIAKFPNVYEKRRLAIARITNILQEYIPSMQDGELLLQKYYQRKENRLRKYNASLINEAVHIPTDVFEGEIQKFSYIAEVIRNKLMINPEDELEKNWQNLITTILPLVFSQYVAVLSDVEIHELYTRTTRTKRIIDFVLINANGYIDILEIKKPFASCILRKSQYRDNYIPKSELSGAVMQVEKYIYYLNSLTKSDEEKLTQKYIEQLPVDLKIKIRNPKGLVLLGRSHEFDERQLTDFEFIKRKYSNITDILSYDDLLSRIDNIINAMIKKQGDTP